MTETIEPVRLAGAVLSRSCTVRTFYISPDETLTDLDGAGG